MQKMREKFAKKKDICQIYSYSVLGSFCKCFKLKMRERGGGKDSATMHKIQSSLILKTWIFDTMLPSSPLTSMHGYCYTLICV